MNLSDYLGTTGNSYIIEGCKKPHYTRTDGTVIEITQSLENINYNCTSIQIRKNTYIELWKNSIDTKISKVNTKNLVYSEG